MTSSDPYRADRTWGSGPGPWFRWVRLSLWAAAFGAVYLAVFVAMFGWSALPLLAVMIGAILVYGLVTSLREAHRVTLYRDGTLELVRPIGTVRVGVGQVRALRLVHYSEGDGVRALRMVTDRGTYLIWHQLGDVRDLADALREHNPRIERRGV